MNQTDIKNAKVIWEYMQLNQVVKKSDAILCLCSHDIRVAVKAAELMKDGYADTLIFSGGSGKLTKKLFNEPEAVVFKKKALELGINEDKIILETESTNTGENVRFTYRLLQEMNLNINSFILVQKPYMERRTFATFKKQWPKDDVSIFVTSPKLSFEDYTEGDIPIKDILNIMVGDLQRIKEYPRLGFQIEQFIPDNVWRAFEELVSAGYSNHLIK